jgi:hypothetical protein
VVPGNMLQSGAETRPPVNFYSSRKLANADLTPNSLHPQASFSGMAFRRSGFRAPSGSTILPKHSFPPGCLNNSPDRGLADGAISWPQAQGAWSRNAQLTVVAPGVSSRK